MKKLRMLLPIGAVIGMLAVGTAFPAMAAVVDTDTAKFVRGHNDQCGRCVKADSDTGERLS